MSNSLQPHGLQHARLPCPSLSPSLLRLMSSDSMMSPKHLILCHPLLLLPLVFPSIRVFSNELPLCIGWPTYRSFTFSISTSSEYSGLISSRIDWFHLLAIQGTLKSLLQHQEDKTCHCFHFSPIFLQWSDGTGCHDILFFFFWMLSFKQVIGKKCIYLGRNTLRRQSVGHLRRWETEIVDFYGLGNFIGKWVGGLFQLFWGRGRDFQELDHHSIFELASELS